MLHENRSLASEHIDNGIFKTIAYFARKTNRWAVTTDQINSIRHEVDRIIDSNTSSAEGEDMHAVVDDSSSDNLDDDDEWGTDEETEDSSSDVESTKDSAPSETSVDDSITTVEAIEVVTLATLLETCEHNFDNKQVPALQNEIDKIVEKGSILETSVWDMWEILEEIIIQKLRSILEARSNFADFKKVLYEIHSKKKATDVNKYLWKT